MIHVEPIVSTVRWYTSGSYAERSEYDAAATLLWLGSDTVYITALRGTINRAFRMAIEEHLRSAGVKLAKYERHGRVIEVDLTKEPRSK